MVLEGMSILIDASYYNSGKVGYFRGCYRYALGY